MKVEFKFEIGDKVTSDQLGFTGTVENASFGRGGNEYFVLAFADKAFVSRWLSENLLRKA